MQIEGLDPSQLELALKLLPKLPPAEQAEMVKLLEAVLANQELSQCRAKLLPFIKKMWPQFIVGSHHKIIADAFERVAKGELKRLCISIAPRSGKALALDTPVPTPTGWSTIGDLRPGDLVLGADGNPTKVVAKSPVWRDRPAYVVSSDGHEVVADAEHEWTVQLDRKTRRQVTRSTRRIADRRVHADRAPRLPDQEALVLPDADLPIPPYTLGVWLGDGSSANAVITAHDEDAPHVRGRIDDEGVVTADQKTRMTFSLLGVRVPMREMGVLGNKHIPQMYLRASHQQRLALLQGLMDTDGSVAKNGTMEFYNCNLRLIENVRELVHTFGVRCTLREKRATLYGKDCGPAYTLAFYLRDAVSLPRKLSRLKPLSGRRRFGRYISIAPTSPVDTQCIEVDAEDHLFLVGRGMIPTHNSEMSSYMFPAWFLGLYPDKKIMQASHKAELAVGFGRKVRNLVSSEEYHEVFPNVGLRADSKAAGRWNTSQGGSYYATGVGAGLAGFGADICIIDDPHDEQEAIQAAHNPEIFAKAWDWYQTGPRQRLQPGGAIIIIATRWSKQDLIGKVTQAMIEKEGADKWEVIELPAILPSGKSYWPEFWPIEELLSTKANIQPVRWNAQYMSNPTGEEGAIVKREWWKRWTRPKFPECEYVIQSWDTAFRATTRSNYSVCTTLGVFRDDEGIANILVLDVWRDRVEFPDLKKKAIELYQDHRPDACIIEAKANGDALINEMRMMGIPVADYTPSRGQDKIVRLNAVADLFASGMVWAPNTRWADEMIEEMAEFPYGQNDDQVDALTLGLSRFRLGNFIRLESDEEEDEVDETRLANYYV